MDITEKHIEEWFKGREELRNGFYSIFDQPQIKSYLPEAVERSNLLDYFFDYCQAKSRNLTVMINDSEKIGDLWLGRNNDLSRLLNTINTGSHPSSLTIIVDGKPTVIKNKMLLLDVRDLLLRYYSDFKPQESNRKPRVESIVAETVKSLRPFYECLISDVFHGRGRQYIASEFIAKMLTLFGFDWTSIKREPALYIREQFQKSRK